MTKFGNCMFHVGCVFAILKFCIWNYEKWGCGGLLGFPTYTVCLLSWVFFRDSSKGWWVMFGSPLEDNIYILNIKYCDLNYLDYVHHELVLFPYAARVIGSNYILGIREFVCYVMPNIVCWGSWEKDRSILTPRLIDLLLQKLGKSLV